MEITIETDNLTMIAELDDTETARALYRALPIEALALTWGEEIYFEVPIKQTLDETAREVVQPGDLGYWPNGQAFCLFFGPTPISAPGEIRPASAVNIIGRVKGDPRACQGVPQGASIKLSSL